MLYMNVYNNCEINEFKLKRRVFFYIPIKIRNTEKNVDDRLLCFFLFEIYLVGVCCETK